MTLLEVPWWWPDMILAFGLACYFLGIFVGSFFFDRSDKVRYSEGMNKPKSQRGREIAEQRRSGAAGVHGKHSKNRRNKNRLAIDQSRRDHED